MTAENELIQIRCAGSHVFRSYHFHDLIYDSELGIGVPKTAHFRQKLTSLKPNYQ